MIDLMIMMKINYEYFKSKASQVIKLFVWNQEQIHRKFGLVYKYDLNVSLSIQYVKIVKYNIKFYIKFK